MTTRVLVAGDHFVLNRLLIDAVRSQAPGELEFTEITLDWPLVPFGRVAEVDEASGTEEQMIEALAGAEICLTQMGPLTRRVIEACPRLKLIGIGRGGPVNANLDAAAEHGVTVCYAPGRNAGATAEHTLGMILAAARRIPQTHADLTAGMWRGDYYRYDAVGIELSDSTVGLVGGGAVGLRVARMLDGLGARVLIHDPYLAEVPVGEPVSLDELLSRADVVSLHARVTPETTGMIGAPRIAAMRPGAIIVNCARGALLDYEAVCDSIEAGHLFGAAFDVFPEEPIPAGSRLLSTPGIVLTPHLAGASRQTAANAARILAEDVGRYLRGEPLTHVARA